MISIRAPTLPLCYIGNKHSVSADIGIHRYRHKYFQGIRVHTLKINFLELTGYTILTSFFVMVELLNLPF